ncbi:MAG TPA: hypothetical protein ENH04_02880, partial [Nitrospirae bacterium]|nr:hypothetical protein [Nitrospirota bacterium]
MRKIFILFSGLIFILCSSISVFALHETKETEYTPGSAKIKPAEAAKKSGERIYVTNAGNNTISVIDAAKKEVISTFRVGV